MYMCMYVCMYICICAYMHICICIYTYAYAYAYTCMHTDSCLCHTADREWLAEANSFTRMCWSIPSKDCIVNR